MRTVILLATLSALLLVIGELAGGFGGLLFAFIFAILLNFISYYYSDKIVLKIYRATELPQSKAKEIHKMVEKLSKSAGIPKPKIYSVPMKIPNAFATGRDPAHSAVAVTEAITDLLNKDELEAVLAHEISHIKNRDTLVSTIAATVATTIVLVARMSYYAGFFVNPRDRRNATGRGMSFLLMVIVAPLAATLIRLAISREREYGADSGAKKLTEDDADLISALKKISQASGRLRFRASETKVATAHMFIVNPFSGNAILNMFSTHPSLEKRIENLKNSEI